MINKIILASKSKVRKKILEKNGINCEVIPANVDEDQVKESLIKEKENSNDLPLPGKPTNMTSCLLAKGF